VFACLFLLILAPGLFKLIPIIIGASVVWSNFNVAKGFATGDVRREREDW